MPEKTMDAIAGFRVVAPGSKTIRLTRMLLVAVAAVGAVSTLALLGAGVRAVTGRGLGMSLTMLITGALGFSGMWVWLRNVRLLIGRGVVGYRNFFGRSRFWTRGEIDHVVSMAVSYRKSSQPLRGIFCLGPDGKRLLALNVGAWPPDDLKAFVEAIGRPLDFRDAPITAKDARREFPNAFGWDSQHIMLMTILTMLGAVVLAVAGYVLVSKLLLK